MTDENSDRLWKKCNLFEIPQRHFQNFIALLNVWLQKIIVLFKGRVIFRQYIPKEHNLQTII